MLCIIQENGFKKPINWTVTDEKSLASFSGPFNSLKLKFLSKLVGFLQMLNTVGSKLTAYVFM